MTADAWKKIRGSAKEPDEIMLSVKKDPAFSMTVRWRTDVTVDTGYVLYRKAGSDGKWMRADADKNHFKTDVDESNFFFADMDGLAPDTYYEYTCGDEMYRSDVFKFRSARSELSEFSFLCLSDIQTGGPTPPADYKPFGKILKKILSEHPECEFILTAGDNTNCGQTDVQWTGLFEGLKGISESIPIMFCMGNHDDMGYADYFSFSGKYYSEKATYFSNHMRGSYPDNGPEDWKTANYSFDYGNVHIAVTGTSGFDDINTWLIEDAAKSGADWKFGVHHFPVCFSGPNLECEDTYPAMRDGMEKFDIIFSGHEHSFARSYPRRNDGLYDRPSEGTVHYNLGSGNRNPPGTRVVPKVWNAKTYEHEEELSMFTVVDINGKHCTLTAYVEDGRIVDRCEIDKNSDFILPFDRAPMYNRPRLKFKGYDLGLCQGRALPEKVDGSWYIPIGQVVSFIGGEVVRRPGAIKASVYRHYAEFYENSDIVNTDKGDVKMSAPCLRMSNGQLYAPVEDFCRPFTMHHFVFEHNNFITIESPTEESPLPYQP